ncbi:hypothetical protein [Methylocapsa aurea]|uniref:hypothetical protein n=1 Tax=Methylocapsa aurea TaxID=663610 RepID=UPI00056B0535|nr:hypothetical protein [Methylocapsa aurea]
MASDYAFIRAYGKFTEAKESYVDDQVRRARRENAPNDAFAYDDENKRWKLFAELEEIAANGDAATAETVKTIRAIMR